MTYQEEFNNSYNDPERMLYLLRNHLDEIDPSSLNNKAIKWASLEGHLEIVKKLLTDSRVDPSDWDNQAIIWASMYDHIEVVKLLLSDERVDPSAQDNIAIRLATEEDYPEIVKLLEDYQKHEKFYSKLLRNI